MVSKSVEMFERAFAEYQGAVCARTFWMGRVGLYAVLRALGVTASDRVGICAYTCLGVVEAVTRIGAIPVWLDVNQNLVIAPQALERLNAPIKVLVAQHTFGVPAPMDAYFAWASKNKVEVIEDCCQAPDARWGGKRVGNVSRCGIFSMEWSKPFTAGCGGIVSFTDENLAREVDRLIASEGVQPSSKEWMTLMIRRRIQRWLVTPRTRDVLKSIYRKFRPLQTDALPGPADDFLKLCSPNQAKVGLRAFRRWRNDIERRKDTAAQIIVRLAREGVTVQPPDSHAEPRYLRVPIWVRAKQRILDTAKRSHIDIGGWFATPADPVRGEPLHAMGYDPAQCRTAEEAFARVVTLPVQPSLRDDDLEMAIEMIRAGMI